MFVPNCDNISFHISLNVFSIVRTDIYPALKKSHGQNLKLIDRILSDCVARTPINITWWDSENHWRGTDLLCELLDIANQISERNTQDIEIQQVYNSILKKISKQRIA